MKCFKSEDYVKKGEYVAIHLKENVTFHAEHEHSFIELIYVLSGVGVHSVNGVDYLVKGGDWLFVNYESKHSYRSENGFTFVEIVFAPSSSSSALAHISLNTFNKMCNDKNGGVISFNGEERTQIDGIVKAMLYESKNGEIDSASVQENYLNVLLIKLLRKSGVSSSDKGDVLLHVKNFLDENFSSKITLLELSKRCFYNPSYLSRAFKQRFNITITNYIKNKRLEKANELITNTNLTIESIISTIGYADRTSFYREFSKKYGITPITLREKSKN